MPVTARICLYLSSFLLFSSMVVAIPYDIVDAARRGDEHAVRKLLESDSRLVQSKDGMGYTALDWAAVRGHWVIFRQLLDAGAPVNVVGGDGGTPMHKACHHERPEMIKLLLDSSGDLSIANQWGRVPLHVVARRGHCKTAALLIDSGADINATTKEDWTPLHVAYMAGQPEMVKLLLARGADPDRTDADDRRPGDMAMTRPPAIELATEALHEYTGHYDLGGGYSFKIWNEEDGLHIREFAPDGLYPVGKDEFYCVQEPWRVTFNRNDRGVITSVDVAFLRRTVQGRKRAHPEYVGSQECKACHFGGEHENQYITWITSRHAAAYWRLATDWAKLLTRFRDHNRDITRPIEEERCLLCHLTIAQDPDALVADTYRLEEGVGCETCHGPGSLYMDPEIMADREQFLANGGIVPDDKTCRKCHRNPDRFDFATWWPKIDHKRAADTGTE